MEKNGDTHTDRDRAKDEGENTEINHFSNFFIF